MNMAEEISIATCHHEQYLAHCCSLVKDIGCEMISVLASSAVDRVFEPQSGQTKDYTIGISYLSAKHASLGRKSKDWLARNQDNVSERARSADCYFSELENR
jgi:hypothetical protein